MCGIKKKSLLSGHTSQLSCACRVTGGPSWHSSIRVDGHVYVHAADWVHTFPAESALECVPPPRSPPLRRLTVVHIAALRR